MLGSEGVGRGGGRQEWKQTSGSLWILLVAGEAARAFLGGRGGGYRAS